MFNIFSVEIYDRILECEQNFSEDPNDIRRLIRSPFKRNNALTSCDSADFLLQVAARTLGDLVRKLGERVLPEIIPILEKGLDSEKNDERQGVCIGLSEIVASTSKEQVKFHCMSSRQFAIPRLRLGFA